MAEISKKAARLITRYGKAFAYLSWKGSMHPDEHAGVDTRHKEGREALENYIIGLEQRINEMGAITTDAKTPILGDGRRDPLKSYMEFTRGIWIRKNLTTDTLELWYNGKFHCAWDEANVIEPRLDAILAQAVSIGEQEAKSQIRAALGITK